MLWARVFFSRLNFNWISQMMVVQTFTQIHCEMESTMESGNTPYLCLPLHLFFSFLHVFLPIFLSLSLFLFYSFHVHKAYDSNCQKMVKRNFSCNFSECFFLLLLFLLWWCIVNFGMIPAPNNRTWWQWFTDFTAVFAHQHINYTFNAVQSNSIIKITASDKSLAVKQL